MCDESYMERNMMWSCDGTSNENVDFTGIYIDILYICCSVIPVFLCSLVSSIHHSSQNHAFVYDRRFFHFCQFGILILTDMANQLLQHQAQVHRAHDSQFSCRSE